MVTSTSLVEPLPISGEVLRTSKFLQLLEPQCFGPYLKLLLLEEFKLMVTYNFSNTTQETQLLDMQVEDILLT